MIVLISGASGFIGKALVAKFKQSGHGVIRLVRISADEPGVLSWDSPSHLFEGLDAVVHLSGEPIFHRWTETGRKRIISSRVATTSFLCDKLKQLRRPPKVFMTPSAVGYYGDRGEEVLTERSGPGTGFLPTVCEKWERASCLLEEIGVRTVQLRFGIVVGKGGGIIQQLLLPYRLGLGGPLGSGKQWVSWISLQDLVAVAELVLKDEHLQGPINTVSPHPVRQEEFARQLAALLHRPALLRQPRWVLRLLFGRMADEVFLSSAHVVPGCLLKQGFSFQHPTLDTALRSALELSL